MKPIPLSIGLLLLLSIYSTADTVYFDRGHWNGTVTYDGNKFTVVSASPRRTDHFDVPQIKRIELNDEDSNPSVLVCPWWKRILLFYPDCGIDSTLGGWFGERPSKTPKYRPAKPPVSAAPDSDAEGNGISVRLELASHKSVECILLKMSETDLTIHPVADKKGYERSEVLNVFPQRRTPK